MYLPPLLLQGMAEEEELPSTGHASVGQGGKLNHCLQALIGECLCLVQPIVSLPPREGRLFRRAVRLRVESQRGQSVISAKT